jgi:hypothetical protein
MEAFSYYFLNLSVELSNWIVKFLFFWLVEGPKKYWKKVFSLSLAFESLWATLITLRYFFSPLYQDYSLTGRIIGPFFRLGRIIIGIFFHLLLLGIYSIIFLGLCLIFWGAPFLFLINLFIWS